MLYRYVKHYGVRYLAQWGLRAGAEVLEGVIRSVLSAEYNKNDQEVQKIFRPLVTSNFQGSVRILGIDIDPEHVEFTVDPITGRRFPSHHYKLLRYETRFLHLKKYMKEGSDVKRVWDISRLQYVIVKPTDKNYRKTKNIILRWLMENPPGKGINWITPMEVAIRGINLVLYYHVFERFLRNDDEFRKTLKGAIRVHGEYLWKERLAEYGPIRGNHYNSDMLGLMVIGAFLKEKGWFEYGRKALEHEMKAQVWSDGVSWEVSTNYHRLNTEIFTIAAVVASRVGRPFPEWWMKKLHRMHLFLAWITKPNGLSPLIGDNDNGRIVDPELNRDRRDFRDVLDVGAVLFKDGRLKMRKEPGPLLGILMGEEGIESFKSIVQRKVEGVAHFKNSGYVIVRKREFFFITRCGPVGLGGTGGHAHNDLLSFELYDSRDIIIDPGMPCYTGCPEKRNRYRSTTMHNTVVVDNIEQNALSGDLFKLFENATDYRVRTSKEGNIIAIKAEYRIPRAGIAHQRLFKIDTIRKKIEIEDTIEGNGKHLLRILFLTPEMPETKNTNKIQVANYVIEHPNGWKTQVENVRISPAYGEKIPGYKIVIGKHVNLPIKVRITIRRL